MSLKFDVQHKFNEIKVKNALKMPLKTPATWATKRACRCHLILQSQGKITKVEGSVQLTPR